MPSPDINFQLLVVVVVVFGRKAKASLLARGLNCVFPFEAVNKVLNQLLCRAAAPEFRMKRKDVKMGRWPFRRDTHTPGIQVWPLL